MENLSTKVAGGKTRQMSGNWTTDSEKELLSIMAQSIADEIDKELVDDLVAKFTITVTCIRRPKKGDLIRHVWDEHPWFTSTPAVTQPIRREQTGLCIEDDMVLMDNGTFKSLKIVEETTHRSYVEVIS